MFRILLIGAVVAAAAVYASLNPTEEGQHRNAAPQQQVSTV